MLNLLARLTRTNRLLLLVFVALTTWALAQYLLYRPGSRLYMRTTYDDAYGWPVYMEEVNFWPGDLGVDYQPRNLDNELVLPGVDSAEVRTGTPIGTWGQGNAEVEGHPLPLPTALAVRYTSVVEQRSYGGRVALPRARLDSLLDYLRAHPTQFEQLYSYPKEQPGIELLAGLGPGGRVVVWVKGHDYQAVLARAVVPAVPTTWPKPAPADNYPNGLVRAARTFAQLRRQVARAELAHLDSFPHSSPARLDSLAWHYRYRLRVVGQPVSPATVQAHFLDLEETPLPVAGGDVGELYRTVPDYFDYRVAGAGLPTHERTTVLEPGEARRAFAQVRAACAPGEVPELLLTAQGENVRVQLRCRRLAVPLPHAITYVGPE